MFSKRCLSFIWFISIIQMGCGLRETSKQTFRPGLRAKAVGVSQTAQKGADLLAASNDQTITVTFRPKVSGPYSVAVTPQTGFRAGLLEKEGIPERIALKMEVELYRFGPPQSKIVFHKEGRRGVSSTTSHNRFVTVPHLLTAFKRDGEPLQITLAKESSGQIAVIALD